MPKEEIMHLIYLKGKGYLESDLKTDPISTPMADGLGYPPHH